MSLAVRVHDLCKDYVLSGETVHALRGVSFDVPVGDYISIMGASGSGKSTLLNLLGCLDRPTAGEYHLSGVDVAQMSDDQLAEIRATRIGFIFQSYNLLSALSVEENIEVPLYYSQRINSASRRRCRELADLVGLGERLHHRPTQLSGGQQQRVAIARSLINQPRLLLGDEPTGNLDSKTGVEVMEMLRKLNEQGQTVVLVTHDPRVSQYTTRSIHMLDGRIIEEELAPL